MGFTADVVGAPGHGYVGLYGVVSARDVGVRLETGYRFTPALIGYGYGQLDRFGPQAGLGVQVRF